MPAYNVADTDTVFDYAALYSKLALDHHQQRTQYAAVTAINDIRAAADPATA